MHILASSHSSLCQKEEMRDSGARSWKAWVLINETSCARLRKMFSQHESASNTGRRRKILCIPCGRIHQNISNECCERNRTPCANKLSWEDLELPVMAVCNCYRWRPSWVLPLKETSPRPRRRPSSKHQMLSLPCWLFTPRVARRSVTAR